MEHAYINRDIVRWARERSGFTRDELAGRLSVSPQQVSQWENGPQFPPFGRAQQLAKTLEIPFGYLFLSTRPSDQPPIPDLRSVDDSRRPPSPQFIDLLNDVMVKHDWYVEYAKESGAARLPFVGRFSTTSPISEVVRYVRAVIGSGELRKQARTWTDYLRLLAQNAEGAGILVMRAGVVRGNPRRAVSVKEFRGFAINDVRAPLIFINSKDAVAAQIFTLAHELIHIWIGKSGISNPDLIRENKPTAQRDVIEQYCNAAAAELLVPAGEFEVAWRKNSADSSTRADNLAKSFKISVPVILRRAYDLGSIKGDEFFGLWQSYRDKVEALDRKREEEGEEESSGGNFYNTFFVRNSYKLTQAVVASVRNGGMSPLEAARLLNIRVGTIPIAPARNSHTHAAYLTS